MGGDEGTGRGGTVLVVDDDPDVRRVASLILQRAGYDTMEAENGAQAVAAVEQHPDHIDVVLLDVMMPTMTGHDALPAIRRVVPTMPVVLFSGYDRNEVTDLLQEADAHTTFLPKPFQNRELVVAITEGIEARRDRS